ncbi:DUF3034 family protein [Shewanella ulleungensis]|uniref:DUF3034 family protein n=1 Tax=Shewanella ulleungensis TaxID=2282699 RepID=UPI003D7A1A5A
MFRNILIISLLIVASISQPVHADTSKVIATGGATTIEGAAGGGIVPWAVINGYASSDQWSVTAMSTQVSVDDFTLHAVGASLSIDNRFELSLAKQTFDLDTMGGKLGQDIIGIKYKLVGELLYSSLPQISLGMQYKRVDDFAIPQAVGARNDWGLDIYLAASKVYFDAIAGRNLVTNLTLRATKANQTGLLGFGTAADNDYHLQAEASIALLLTDNFAVGYEYKQKPNQLGFAKEDDWQDIFAAWFINKHLSLVGAYADLGSIAGFEQQNGWYLSIEGTL